jgi:hypothetical protein
MPGGNRSRKLAITVDTQAPTKSSRRAGLAAVAEWEKQHGPFSAEEMDEARRSVRTQLRTARAFRRPA